MRETTDNFAVSPGVPLDALSDLLQSIHLRSGPVTRVRGSGAAGCRRHMAGARMMHVIQRGRVRVECATAPPVELAAGDLALVAKGVEHDLHAYPDAAWVTGEFLVDDLVAHPVLRVLPSTIVVTGGTEGTEWLPLSVNLILAELEQPRPGSRVMVSRIFDLLFIRALRAWAAAAGPAEAGSLSAAMDPVLGPVVAAIHEEPQRARSVAELARLAAMSPTAFAVRFTTLLGQTPGVYVRRQRLGYAAGLLTNTTEPIGRIAARAGYDSEAAFSRAFTREHGVPPRAWRAKTRPTNGPVTD